MNESIVNPKSAWSVWIDENKKVILIKENPSEKEIFFDNKNIGIKAITDLV